MFSTNEIAWREQKGIFRRRMIFYSMEKSNRWHSNSFRNFFSFILTFSNLFIGRIDQPMKIIREKFTNK